MPRSPEREAWMRLPRPLRLALVPALLAAALTVDALILFWRRPRLVIWVFIAAAAAAAASAASADLQSYAFPPISESFDICIHFDMHIWTAAVAVLRSAWLLLVSWIVLAACLAQCLLRALLLYPLLSSLLLLLLLLW